MNTQPFMRFKLRDILLGADWYFLGMLVIYTVIQALLITKIPNIGILVLQNVCIAITIISIATLGKYRAGTIFLNIHRYYHLPIIYVVFMQAFVYISVLNPHDYDPILVSLDKAIFGMNPTEWLQQQNEIGKEWTETILSDHMGWNGIYYIDFETPIYRWIHKKLNLGWLI